MSLIGAAISGPACSNCRRLVLRSFIATIGGPASQIPKPSIQSTRRFTKASPRLQEPASSTQSQILDRDFRKDAVIANAEHTDSATLGPASTKPSSDQDAPVPWYLQVQQPILPQENALSARQKIPDLPDHPPPILQALLERVSVDLGMDDLTLLDLRSVDPPPALGANLLMIIGTARSEKHLHVSADRLCRWLRSEYHLRPHADGLLGRNELKLRMRRRAKRMRLLSGAGAQPAADSEIDDGIRTGWICVNVGQVEGGELPKSAEELERERKIVGFNFQSGGSRIVVQMMTEEKRGEIDLDRLWTGVLKKSKREREALEAEPNGAEDQPLQEMSKAEDHLLQEASTVKEMKYQESPPLTSTSRKDRPAPSRLTESEVLRKLNISPGRQRLRS